MAKYSYCNGVYMVDTYIRYGWKRYHNMNAQYRIQTCLDDEMTVNGCRVFKRYSFISYATPILHAVHDSKYDSWIIELNYNALHYSPTTSRQLGKFLREYDIPLTLYDIKQAEINECFLHFDPSDNVTVWWAGVDRLERSF